MNELEDKLLEDLILISQKKEKIADTLAFTRKTYEKYLIRRRKTRKRVLTISISAAAAIFLLSIMVLPTLLPMQGNTQYNILYVKFNPELATRGSGTIDQISEVVILYATGQYPKALAKADSLLQMKPQNSELLFFKGLTEMELNQYEQSIGQFTKVIPLGGPYESYSRWYLALIYLKLEKYTECRNQLAALKEIDGNPYKKQVNKLYRELRFRRNP